MYLSIIKKSLKDINENRLGDNSSPNLNQNEEKSIYLTEVCMYYLIFHYRNKVKEFEVFIYTIFFQT